MTAKNAGIPRAKYPIRCVILMPWGERLGGAEEMLWTFLQNVDTTRLRITVVALESGPFVRDIETLHHVEVLSGGRLRHLRRMGRTVFALRRMLRAEPDSLLISWGAKMQIYGGLTALTIWKRPRTLWWQHGLASRHWLDRIATVLPADAVGCSSEAAAAAQRKLKPRRRTFVVHPGITPPRVDGHDRNEVRARVGFGSDDFVVGTVGRLQPGKGQDRLIEAVQVLHARGKQVRCLIVGGNAYNLSPEFSDRVEQLPGALGLADSVALIDHVEDVTPYLTALDVFVSASDGESFGIVLLEAMAQGLPVVATAKGGPLEIVEPGVSGLLVPAPSALELANAIDKLLVDDAMRAAMGRAGQRVLQRKFSVDSMTERLTSELEVLADRNG